MAAHRRDGDTFERGVGLAVATTAGAMARDLAAGRGHRADAAEHGERGVAAHAVGVVPEEDEECRGRDVGQRRQVRRTSLHRALEVGVVFVDPGVQITPSPGQRSKCLLGRRRR
jgi:hypothetical protein